MTTLQIFSATQMKSAVSFLVFLLTLLLVLTVSPLLCSTTQLLIYHFLFPLFSTPPSQQVYFLQTGKTPILYLSPNEKLSSSSSDYHPISLFSLPSKILERHVFKYLYKFCFPHNILSNCQFGFRPGFLTETAILSIVKSWFFSLDHKNVVCSVFFNLTKAFDSVPHKALLDSLSLLGLPYFLS